MPLTKSGRQRKLGSMLTGGGCLLPTIFLVLLALSVVVSTAKAALWRQMDQFKVYLPIVMKPYTPVPLPGENLQCNTVGNAEICASVSDMTPDKYSYLTVRGRLLIGGVPQVSVPMFSTWHFKTTTSHCDDGITNNDGIAYCGNSIFGAASGFQVNIDVSIGGYSVTTWFITN